MGRKSRLKKERRESGMTKGLSKKLVLIDEYNNPIYRFFKEKWQAEALCQGNIWISTLETCRKYEDLLQGDSQEAIHTYKSGHIIGDSNNSNFIEMASCSGISIGEGCSNITIKDCKSEEKIIDAYILCFTYEYNPQNLSNTFGNYCVKISNPKEFFYKLSAVLNKENKIKEAASGLVKYKDREYTGLQPTPGPIGFVKPIHPYSSQKEFRMLWINQNTRKIEPFLLNCSNVSEFCTLI